MKVIVVGAGLAGLTCAKVISENGADVEVFEASDGVGGRVRTDERDGFLLDRGFQVYFTAYPASSRHLDHGALDLRAFDPGAVVCRGGGRDVLADPLRDPKALLPSLFSDVAGLKDKLLTLRLAASAAPGGVEAAGEWGGGSGPEPDESSEAYLRRAGFSERFIDGFFRPFYGGILLDRSLSTSAKVLRFTFRMLATGKTAVPARGMGAIPRQLLSRLPEGAVRLNEPVRELLRDGDGVTGIRTAQGEHEADAVVVAAEGPEAARLSGADAPRRGLAQTCVYYSCAPGSLGGKKIMLNAEDEGFLNNVVEVSQVAPGYAPEGRGLVSAVALGEDSMKLTDEETYRRGMQDITRWAPEADLSPLAVYRIPFAQFDQPPGIHATLAGNEPRTPGLYLAGEYTQDSSINGSMLSGERAAGAVLAATREAA
ncbi:NAD(P)/FAD-dependent oxidoreductase [Rubrobacter aplysinae]|uniref:NAD(P)/FAD-dependent oxidoreductase n=1 Tax=Rubrobacter aplysinae TaxID=909625 RepID=UPI00064BD9FD|nr:NAD(P)/FAD-dependent oxidoreductase [Rubrobacter aplysinae]